MDTSVPLKLSQIPGDYGVLWTLNVPGTDERQVLGTVKLLADEMPRGTLQGTLPMRWTEPSPGTYSADMPQDVPFDWLDGRLGSGAQVRLIEGNIGVFSETQGYVDARAALVGSFGRSVEPGSFTHLKVQLSNLDRLAGRHPIKHLQVPQGNDPHLSGTWTVEGAPDSTSVWSSDDAEVTFSFQALTSGLDFWRFAMTFSPVIEIELKQPKSFDEWMTDWVEPLRLIVSLATGRGERFTYMALGSKDDPSWVRSNDRTAWAQVFGTGVLQAPFASEGSVRRPEPAAILFRENGPSLLNLVSQWVALRSENHPLIETYGTLAGSQQQHPRSRFLLLLQAIEGLHGHETRSVRAEQEARHLQRQEQVLEGFSLSYALRRDVAFVRKYLSRKPFAAGLHGALIWALKELPVDVTDDLKKARLVGAAERAGAHSMPDAIRRIRNDLAHGTRGYEAPDLHEVAEILARVTRAHLLRLLGSPADTQERALNMGS